jgi:uncharacterized repeat protein (TIGR03803 family)
LIRDATGNLYGTTQFGGTSPCSGLGCGTVFKVGKNGKLMVLHTFTGGTDGSNPEAGLILNGASLYGTTPIGGAYNLGTLFKLNAPEALIESTADDEGDSELP